MKKKYVYLFKEGNAGMRNLLGGKGANLAEMTNLGLPVPQGFTISTEACTRYYKDDKMIGEDIKKQIEVALVKLEKITGKAFGNTENPLLVSVRSGARISMPGMMDTILNLGLNDEVVIGLAKLTNNERFAYDSYRRFIMMFSNVAMGVDKDLFEAEMNKIKKVRGIEKDTDMTAEDLKKLVKASKEVYKKELKQDFPQNPQEQLMNAVKAVFHSWDNPRANIYRQMNQIPHEWGTAVNVQMMVFGNMGEESGTGVAFTRNPSTGENKLYGEYLMDAQGEDVVSGVRTPSPISDLEKQNKEVYDQFVVICNKLEKTYKDMQDMEFTIENGKLYMLQTRNGKRTAFAALQIAIDLVNSGMIGKKEALMKIDPKSLDSLLHQMFDPTALKKAKVIAKGLPASPGAACGKIVLTPEKAKDMKEKGEEVVLVRSETSPEDIEGMVAAQGVLTATGGMTSHAAVVARGMGTACVAGCKELSVREEKGEIVLGGKKFKEGDFISIDGSTGNIYAEKVATKEAEISGNFATIMKWADEFAVVKVRANADNGRDAKKALELGATGIGLCRTEHMFFEPARIKAVREMILSKTPEERKVALDKILPMQKKDFIDLFRVMEGLPVTIRFLDPPLHEFLPHEADEQKELAKEMGKTFQEIKDTVDSLSEFNPMMGFRGCRLAIVMPEIAVMQTTAVIQAAIECAKKYKMSVLPEIMVPLVGDIREFRYVKNIIAKTADELIKEANIEMQYRIGTMIEIPRAALTSGEIAKEAEFFSFGTNDLTQMTFGFSRDDTGNFLTDYFNKKIFENDPFVRVDEDGVGKLIDMTVKNARAVRKDFKCGICGEQGADPASVKFAHKEGINYVSCSPFRVPIARLASAQAAISASKK